MTECNTVGFHMFQKLYIALSINYGSEVKLNGIVYLLKSVNTLCQELKMRLLWRFWAHD